MNSINLYKLPKDILVKLLVEKYNPDIFTLKEIDNFKTLLSDRELKLINERQDYFTDLFKNKYFPLININVKLYKDLSTYIINLITHTFSYIYIISKNDDEFNIIIDKETTIYYYKEDGEWVLKRKINYNKFDDIDMDIKKEFIKIHEDRKELLEKWNSY